jgi:hypothetical protein
VWVEEGKYTLVRYLDQGAWNIVEPLAGYLLIASKIIAIAAFKLSILWTPEIEIALTTALTCAVVCAVAFSPTHLRWPFACAIVPILVPTDPEVFAVSSYAFWWAGLLLPLALLWDARRGREWLRWTYIIFGGLSSPIVVPTAALLWLRAICDREQSSFFAAVLASVMGALQIVAIHYQPIEIHAATLSGPVIALSVQKFIGVFFYRDMPTIASFAVLGVLGLIAWLSRARLDWYFVLLGLFFVAICASVALRMPLESFRAIDPFVVGPRYFFYPFIVSGWMMLWLASVSRTPIRIAIVVALAASVLLPVRMLSRRHDAVDWRQHIRSCAQSVTYDVPIHYIGRAGDMWHAALTGAQCRKLIDDSLF